MNVGDLLFKRQTPPGSPPGTVVVDPRSPHPEIRVMAFGPETVEEHEVERPEDPGELLGRHPVTWVNVDGLGDHAVLQQLAEIFGIHQLALEDVVNVGQRPKVDEYPDQLYLVVRMPAFYDGRFGTEQVSLFLGRDYVLTFQESAGDCLEPVRQRIRRGKGLIRKRNADYLAYAILDAVVDGYFPTLESFGEQLETLEEEIIAAPQVETMARVHAVKHDLLTLRRAVWPLRETVNSLFMEKADLISEDTHIYLRDCYDHVIQVLDMLETFRDIASGLIDLYQSAVGNRMNEIMKVLTIIATIFIPLSFVAGLYGMNFDPAASRWNMPELGLRFGYPMALGIMGLIAVLMVLYFRRKGWIGGKGGGG